MSSDDGLSASGGGSADYGSHDRNELFRGARAGGPDGQPRARTAAEIKAAYGHGPQRCARGAGSMGVGFQSTFMSWRMSEASDSVGMQTAHRCLWIRTQPYDAAAVRIQM